MLNCFNLAGNVAGNGADTTVLEEQRARLKWQQEQLQERSLFAGGEFNFFGGLIGGSEPGIGELMSSPAKAELGSETGWPGLGDYVEPDSRPLSEKLGLGGVSCKKRKAGRARNKKVSKFGAAEQDESGEKKAKGCTESKKTEQRSNGNSTSNSVQTSADISRITEVHQKPKFIHVRARRGEATDSHSLAERVRRERISERMKYLQDLVPGCNKITGKAGMLEEIINYVHSLQRQVEFLSMKLAAVNPSVEFNIDSLFAKEVMPACSANFFPTMDLSSQLTNPASLQFNPIQHTTGGLEIRESSDMEFRGTIGAPVSIPETYMNSSFSSCFTHTQPPSTWDAELQYLFYSTNLQGRSASFPSQSFTGPIEASHLKMEM